MKRPGTNLPSAERGQRLIGVTPEGGRVNNVTEANRYDVNPNTPLLLVHLMDEDDLRVIAAVVIHNTRERPDVVMFEGEPFGVVTTIPTIPRYRKLMVLNAVNPTAKEHHNATN